MTSSFARSMPRSVRATWPLRRTARPSAMHRSARAAGDYTGAKRMLDQLAVIRPVLQKAFDKLNDIPVDIEPHFAP